MCVVQIQPWKDSKKLSVYSEGRVWGQLKIISCSTEFLEGKEHTVKIQQADWKLLSMFVHFQVVEKDCTNVPCL